MIVDAHVHLNEPVLRDFVRTLENLGDSISLFSNSVDFESSIWNIQTSNGLRSIIPFVGIHPEIFSRPGNSRLSKQSLDQLIERVGGLFQYARGIGEIGLDPNYGRLDEQEYLLDRILDLAEKSRLPITFHCRNTVTRILDILSSHSIRNKLLFHWFAGTESELERLHDRGAYFSFGPSILFSKRLARLAELSEPSCILAETDSPTAFSSIVEGPCTPFVVPSVVFKLSLIRRINFAEMSKLVEENSLAYIRTQD